MQSVAKEFRTFLLRGNLVELAVAFVIGVAFDALVAALVTDLITPLIAANLREARLLLAQLHDQREPLPLRRLRQRADHLPVDRGGGVLLRRQAVQRADGAARDRAGGG
jgi:hypothetical protein